MNISELPQRLQTIEARLAGIDAQTTALEIATAMADILSVLERQGPSNAQAIAKALREVRLTMDAQELEAIKPEIHVNVETPVVNVQPAQVNVQPHVSVSAPDVNVQPANVTVESPVTVNMPPAPAPVIHMMGSDKKVAWEFDIKYGRSGLIESMKAKQV